MTDVDRHREEYIKLLNALQQENLNATNLLNNFYDKALLYLASGSFVLSINFLKDVIGDKGVVLDWLLIISWFLFTVSILSSLNVYRISQSFFIKRTDTVNDEKRRLQRGFSYESTDQFKQKIEKVSSTWATWVRFFRRTTTVCFFLAFFLLSMFSIINVGRNYMEQLLNTFTSVL